MIYFMLNDSIDNELVKLIDYTKLSDIVMAEIGSYKGESANSFLSTGKVKQIACIDTWLESYSELASADRDPMNIVESDFDNRIKQYGDKVIKLKAEADIAHKYIKDSSLDLIYIDGLHNYDNIKADIINYSPKVRAGGFICGHDFHHIWPGVQQAVRELLGEPDIVFNDNSWVKVK